MWTQLAWYNWVNHPRVSLYELSELGWLGFRDLATLFFLKVCMCSYEKPGWPGYRNIYKEKSGEARSRKPSHCGWPGSCEEVPKTTGEVKSSQAPPSYTVHGEGSTNYLIATYPPLLSGTHSSRTLYSHERIAEQPRAKKTDLINTSWIQSITVIVHFGVTLTILRKSSLWYSE